MRLYASAPSPFARKVRIALIELGLADRVTVVNTVPVEDAGYRAVNPLGKIPALELDDGTIIPDSLVIIDWLDRNGTLIPRDGEARNLELRHHALADGIIDAAFAITSELRRPEEQRSPFWIERWSQAIEAGAAALPGLLRQEVTLASITAVTAADYVDFRLSELGLDIAPLQAWRSHFVGRASFDRTAPQLELA